MDTIYIIALCALILIGAFAGVIAGLLGAGGGVVLVPAFYYTFTALGYGDGPIMQISLATSLATIIVTSMRSTHAHHKKGAVDWPILRSFAPGIAIGAAIGVVVAAKLPSSALQIIFGLLGAAIGVYFIADRNDWTWKPDLPRMPVRSVWGSVMGFLSVLLGIGGGSFGVPFMSLHGVPIHRAVATAAGFGFLIAVPSVVLWLFTPLPGAVPPGTIGAVNVVAFAIIVPMTILTAPIGARLAHGMQPKRLKQISGVFLIFVALNMLRSAF